MYGRTLLCCAALVSFVLPVATFATGTPQVTFLLMRLDRETISLQHAYRYTQPLRKHLVPEGFEDWGEVFVRFVNRGDVNNTEEFLSRFTGQAVFFGEWEHQSEGRLIWPTSAEETFDRLRGLPASDPQRLTVLPMWEVLRPGQKEAIWAAARDLVIVRELEAIGPLNGVIFDFDFDGASWEDDPEILLLLWARSMAPVDAALVTQAWPRTLATRGVRTVPELTLHNFSDEPIGLTVNLEARRDGTVVYSSSTRVEGLAPDATMDVPFDPIVPLHMEPLSFMAGLSTPEGKAWMDAYPENDATTHQVQLTHRPVFRSRPWTRIPLWGEMLDFDGDQDLDVIMQSLPARLYQRGETGLYSNISARVHPPVLWDLRRSFAGEFSGDGLQDVLLNQYGQAPILLAGDGTGNFEQVTALSGLSGLYDANMDLFDLDLDGDLDILARQDHSSNHSAFFLEGPARFVEDLARTGLSSAELNGRPAYARVDGDPRPDLLVARADATDIFVNLPGGGFQRGARLPAARQALPVDYDDDGMADVLTVTGAGTHLHRQSAPLDFLDVTSTVGDIGAAERFIQSAGAADLNADGRPDIVLAKHPQLQIKLTEGGLYTDAGEILVEQGRFYFDFLQLVDWDHDGDTDIYAFWAAFENQGMPLARMEAEVRIRGGSSTSRLAPASRGWLEVRLMGSSRLDVRKVDHSTLAFGPGRLPLPPDAPVRYEDANHDGIEDLSIRYRTDDAGFASSGQEACLEGWTRDGLPFRGCAALVMVRPAR